MKRVLEVLYQDKSLNETNCAELFRALREGIGDSCEEFFIYDLTAWRILFFPTIPDNWNAEDLSKGEGYAHWFQDEMFIASTIKHPSLHLYMHVEYNLMPLKEEFIESVQEATMTEQPNPLLVYLDSKLEEVITDLEAEYEIKDTKFIITRKDEQAEFPFEELDNRFNTEVKEILIHLGQQEGSNNKIELNNPSVVAELIQTKESGLYGSDNVDGEKVAVFIEKGVELTVQTFQDNGWTREDTYDSTGIKTDEIITERWKK